HVAEDACFLVVPSPRFDAELLGGGDLHVVDELPVPDGLEDGVAETEDEEVLHRLLAQVMVDAEDLPLVHHLEDEPVERAGRGEVAAERFLDHDAGETRVERRPDEAMLPELLEEPWKGAGRGREVEEPVGAGGAGAIELVELRREPTEGVVVVEGTGDVAQAG